MNKKDLTEQEIRTRFITPAIQSAGWRPRRIREEYYTAGRMVVRSNALLRLCDDLAAHLRQAQATRTALRDAALSEVA